jgi:hypothetical protein
MDIAKLKRRAVDGAVVYEQQENKYLQFVCNSESVINIVGSNNDGVCF